MSEIMKGRADQILAELRGDDPDLERITAELLDGVRTLAAERDRLAAQVAALREGIEEALNLRPNQETLKRVLAATAPEEQP